MASDEAIKKMMQAIMDKRRQLGLVDWGMVPVEEVIRRLNRTADQADPLSKPTDNLAEEKEAGQNKTDNTPDSKKSS